MVRPYDPDALPQLTALAATSSANMVRLLQRKQARIDELLGKAEVGESDVKAARSLEKEIETIVALVQDYKQIIQQHESESESRWSMIELQDKRCAGLKRQLEESQWQAKQWKEQFGQLADTFQQYVRRGLDQHDKAA